MFKRGEPAAALVAVDWVCHCCGGPGVAEMVEMGRCQRWWAIKGGDQKLEVVEVVEVGDGLSRLEAGGAGERLERC